jgi:hypothetical protein
MPECAFCEHTGKLSAEHVISQWLVELFPGPVDAQIYGDKGRNSKTFSQKSIDYTAKVVCEQCNNGWMSDIESLHAKPSLTPLVTGKFDIPITPAIARSIAIFAFKTAVVIDCSNRRAGPFFSRHLRHAFRRSLFIPNFVAMWFCPYASHRWSVHVKSAYHDGKTTSGDPFHFYACTVALGNFCFQTLAVKQLGSSSFRAHTHLPEDVAVPFWPTTTIPAGYVWPHNRALGSMRDFGAFAGRWGNAYERVEVPVHLPFKPY